MLGHTDHRAPCGLYIARSITNRPGDGPQRKDNSPMYDIVGIYDGEKEVVDTAETQEDADYLLEEYRLAFGLDWILTVEGPPAEYGRIY